MEHIRNLLKHLCALMGWTLIWEMLSYIHLKGRENLGVALTYILVCTNTFNKFLNN